jgi:poly(hydroxyalkanoate) depolymerase family esterase
MYKNGNFAVRVATWVATVGAIGLLSTPRLAAAAAAPVVTDTTEKCGTNTYLKQVTNFGNNPTGLGMYMFVPDPVTNGQVAHPGVLVAAHGCDGSGQTFCHETDFAKLADQYGFIVIYPSANTVTGGTGGANCFEVSGAALTRGGGSDPDGVASMVSYVLDSTTYNADSTRVFATGWSSGAMLTNVLLADYPDKFAAGAPFAGVPVACMDPYDDETRGNACTRGEVSKTALEWGTFVRDAYSGYSGARPRIQIWHGTSDSILNFENFGEEFKQWSNVLGVSATPVSLDFLAFPLDRSGSATNMSATRTRYGPSGSQVLVETISVSGAPHMLVAYPGIAGLAAEAIHFFGLDANADLIPPAVPDTQRPSVPANVQASNVTATGLTLTWSASTDDTGVVAYLVTQKAALDSSPAAPVASLSGTTTSTSISHLSASTTYSFWVQAQDKAGNISNISTTLQVTMAAASAGGGGGSTGGGGGGGGGDTSGSSGGGCSHGSASILALLTLGAWALLRGRRRASVVA